MSKERDELLRIEGVLKGLLSGIQATLSDSTQPEAEPPKEKGPIEPVDPKGKRYNLKAIRVLLEAGFGTGELRRIADEDEFRALATQMNDRAGVSELTDLITDYANRRSLISLLLGWCKQNNSARYERGLPYTY